MSGLGWLERSLADVPASDDWLSGAERDVLAALHFPKRRLDWRLGRFTAKAAVAARLGIDPSRVEIFAAPGGAPVAHIDGRLAPVGLSLSHREGRAVALVADGPAAVGIDLERVEPRSAAFVAEWLSPREQALVAMAGADGPARVANLVWTAKEAAAKVRGAGLRLDVRRAEVRFEGFGAHAREWRRMTVAWHDARPTGGWWCERPGWVLAAAAEPGGAAPERL